ncbi:MAG: sigma-70 family RNA polymerase sigma factor [Chthoniobacteraceae bacterium]
MQIEKPDEAAQADLLRRIAAKDRQAVGELYDQMASPLLATSFRILGDPHEAEEVIQDVFVEIWNKAPVFDDTLGTAFHWVMSITRNRSIDRVRSRQRRAKMLDRLEEFTPLDSSPDGAPQTTGLGTDELAGIRTAVNSLPADQRIALELAFFKGQTHAEIAESTGEPLGTVKARIRRGMLKLRSSLQEYA